MNAFNKIYIKLYYLVFDSLVFKRTLRLPAPFNEKRNLFIYFDYEREFSGHPTMISDKDIKKILIILNNYGIKTTWFTVGKIFEKYTESIKSIINSGHEMGSHTYGHIKPLLVNDKILRNDFQLFHDKSIHLCRVKGFHAPNNQWNHRIFKYLKIYGYEYDLMKCHKRSTINRQMIPFVIKSKLIRLFTVGDDWPLYKSNIRENDVIEYFNMQFNCISKGDLAGIGFHPWILRSDKRIFNGFVKFLSSLSNSKDTCIERAGFYADILMKENQFIKNLSLLDFIHCYRTE